MIGVCILTLNSEATIGFTLSSILDQRPPRRGVFYVVVDGGSRDRTVDIVKELLRGQDYELIVAPGTNIPQARNLCLSEALRRGFEKLLFIDSDTILLARNLLELAERLGDEHGDSIIHFRGRPLYFKTVGEMEGFLRGVEPAELRAEDVELERSLGIGMGFTLIPRRVIERVRFDEDMDFAEDRYFAFKAFLEGFEVLSATGAERCIIDSNVLKGARSDIYWRMPPRRYWRAPRKKALTMYLASLDTRTLEVSRLRFLKRTLRFLANTVLLFVMALTPVAYVLGAGVFYAFLAADLLNLVVYPLVKRMRGLPFLAGVRNRVKFMVYSLLVTVWSYHAYRELKRAPEALRRRGPALSVPSR